MIRDEARFAHPARALPVLLAAVCLAAATAGAQETGVRIYDEQLRVRLDRQEPGAQELGFDAGGWFNTALFTFDDPSGRAERTLRQYELRGWASLNVRGVHRFYVRGLLSYDDWNSGDNPKTWEGDDFQESIERAWYQLDLGRMIRNQTGEKPPVGVKMKVGREYATIGTALALSMPLDMIQFDVDAGNWHFMSLLGKTIRDSRNIDDSPLIATHQERCFYGFELQYSSIDVLGHHQPFVYWLGQTDNSDPTPTDPFQSYAYDSNYLGVGSEGTLAIPNLRYQVEWVNEWGETYSDGVTAGRDDIRATAFDVLLEYLFKTDMNPKVMTEFIYASGDSDRRLSSTSTVGGNRSGTRDHAFNAFGFRDTGIAYAPRVSNLCMYMIGGSFFPLEKHELFRKMEVGSKVFFYHRAQGDAPISESSANQESRWLGWEWDIYCNWRVTSDLTWTIRYGAFQPGSAYDSNNCRDFLYTGLTFSF